MHYLFCSILQKLKKHERVSSFYIITNCINNNNTLVIFFHFTEIENYGRVSVPFFFTLQPAIDTTWTFFHSYPINLFIQHILKPR